MFPVIIQFLSVLRIKLSLLGCTKLVRLLFCISIFYSGLFVLDFSELTGWGLGIDAACLEQ